MADLAYATSEDAANVTVIDLQQRRAVATLPAGRGAHSLALTPDGRRLYIANRRDRSLTVIDTATGSVVATLALSSDPTGVSVSPDGRLLAVAGRTRLVAWLVEVATGALREIPLVAAAEQPARPPEDGPCSTHPVWTSDSATFYLEDNVHAALVRVDAMRGAVASTTPLRSPPHMLYLNAAGDRLYALCSGADGVSPSIAVVDAGSQTLMATLPVPLADGESGELHHATFDATGRRLFVANMGQGRPRGGHSVSVLDTDALAVTARLEARAGAGHPLLSPDGKRLWLVNHASPLIGVYDAESLALVGEAPLPDVRSMGHGCFFTPNGDAFWAVSNSAGAAYAIDTRTLMVVAQVSTGPGCQDIAHRWADASA